MKCKYLPSFRYKRIHIFLFSLIFLQYSSQVCFHLGALLPFSGLVEQLTVVLNDERRTGSDFSLWHMCESATCEKLSLHHTARVRASHADAGVCVRECVRVGRTEGSSAEVGGGRGK